mmetsp:Transcript_74694/g.139436  ORF Transcript_74694/g.139436 Transcript_74694/m.139436 type:complete len:695 (+) Transcript_74694:70-2154(+)
MAKGLDKTQTSMARVPMMLLSILCLGCANSLWKEPGEVIRRVLRQVQPARHSLLESMNRRLLEASEKEGSSEVATEAGENTKWGEIGEGDQDGAGAGEAEGGKEGGEEEGEEGGGEEEGEKEGEEGEEAAEAAGEEKADLTVEDVVFNLAVSVVIFFGVDLGLLYVMKYRDKDIRSYVYRMISSTLSIFMAVMINAAIFSLIVEQLVPAAPPKGLGLHLEGHDEMLMNFIVGLIIYLIFLLTLSVLGYWCRENEEAIYTCNTIGGHLCGFAGIAFYGNWQELCDAGGPLANHHYLFFSIACGTSLCVLLVTTHLRRWLKGNPVYTSAEEKEEKEKWIEEVEEAEDDATALIFSFLAAQLIVWWKTGKMPEMEPDFDNIPAEGDVEWMFLPVCASLFVLGVLTHFKKKCPNFEELGEDSNDHMRRVTRMLRRMVDALQTFCAMTMSWCVLRMGQWQLQIFFADSRMGLPSMIGILNAIFLTGLSCIMIFFLDQLADKLGQMHGGGDLDDEAEPLVPAAQQPSSRPADNQLSEEAARKDHLQRWVAAVRKIIDGFGLLVGLCWERATDAAIEAIVEDVDALKERPVVAKTAAAVIVTAMIFPAWIWYIVPVAKKTGLEHSLSLALERIHTTHMSKRRSKDEIRLIEKLQRLIVNKCDSLSDQDDVCVVTVPVLMNKITDFQKQVETDLASIEKKRS